MGGWVALEGAQGPGHGGWNLLVLHNTEIEALTIADLASL